MLSFRLKIAWCVLSLTGAVCCTLFLWAFGRVAGSKWGPMLYCAGNIVLQGIFCLGMIYRMDPFAMPRSFCMAQSILITFATDVLTGVTIAFSMATYAAVLKPKTWSDGRRALQWRKAYMLPLVAFPAIATTVHIILVVKLDALQPSDGMHCDATAPQWTRLFGFAGVPLLMTLPAIYLSTTSILQIRKTNKHLQRAARPDSLVDEFKRSMSRNNSRKGVGMKKSGKVSKSKRVEFLSQGVSGGGTGVGAGAGAGADTAAGKKAKTKKQAEGREAITPAISSPTFTAKKFHLPLGRRSRSRSRSCTPSARATPQLAGAADGAAGGGDKYEEYEDEEDGDDFKFDDDDASSKVSVTFPTFINPHAMPTPPPPPPALPTQTQTQIHTQMRGAETERRHSAQQQQGIELPEMDGATRDTRNSWHQRQGEADGGDVGLAIAVVQSIDSGSGGDWTVEDDAESKADMDLDVDMADMDIYALSETERYAAKGVGVESLSMSGNSSMPGRRQKRPPPSLAPAIRWLISFQILFIFVQLLATLSVFIDLVSERAEPTPFGTHYVALLLAAWGPVFIFGPIAAVRKNLRPWRPLSLSLSTSIST